jgi:hypothetical protein
MKKTIIIFLIVSLIPIGIIGGSLYSVIKKNVTFGKYKPTKGIIIKINEDKVFDYAYRKRNFYYPTIQYYDDKGESYTFKLKNGSESNLEMLGKEIDLLFNPKNPEDVIVDSFLSKWFGPVIVCAIGLFILIIVIIVGFVVVLKERKKEKNKTLEVVSGKIVPEICICQNPKPWGR